METRFKCGHRCPTKNCSEVVDAPWWINSQEFNFCFWRYVQEKSNKNGELPELSQSGLSKLFGWSNAKTHLMVKEAMDELNLIFKKHDMSEEIGSDVEESVVISSVLEDPEPIEPPDQL